MFSLIKKESGTTLAEILVVLGIIAIIVTSAISNLKILNNDLSNSSKEVAVHFKMIRSRAISTTKAYTLKPTTNRKIAVFSSRDCGATRTSEPALSYFLPSGTTFVSQTWEFCFNPRGLGESSLTVTLLSTAGLTKNIELFVGGAVRVIGE